MFVFVFQVILTIALLVLLVAAYRWLMASVVPFNAVAGVRARSLPELDPAQVWTFSILAAVAIFFVVRGALHLAESEKNDEEKTDPLVLLSQLGGLIALAMLVAHFGFHSYWPTYVLGSLGLLS